jgi:L-serine dehydratase
MRNMALADYDNLIPLDEVSETMYEVRKIIPKALIYNNLEGLSISKISKEIEAKLVQKHFYKRC